MKKIIAILGLLALAACGGGGGGSNLQTLSYYHKSVNDIKDAHAQGITGKNVKIRVIDFFTGEHSTHGPAVTSVIEKVAPGSTITGKYDLNKSKFHEGSSGNNYDVLNLSISDDNNYTYYKNQGNIAANPNALAVVSAGNYNKASETNTVAKGLVDSSLTTIVVGEVTDNGDKLETYSNHAGQLKNHFIVTAGGHDTKAGTSFAAPVVSGAAALIMDKFNNTDGETTKNIILDTADDLGAPGVDNIFGHGRLNIGRALSPVGNVN